MNRENAKPLGTDDLYRSYRSFELAFRSYAINTSSDTSSSEHYRDNWGLMDDAEFREHVAQLSEPALRSAISRWRRGFASWIKVEEARQAEHQRRAQWASEDVEVVAEQVLFRIKNMTG